MNGIHRFDLPPDELEFLRGLAASDAVLGCIVDLPAASGDGSAIALTLSDVERVRDILTLHLAESGFDESYEPNETGVLLERLIARLYVP